ncbi:dinitrogenase iron-molybdenum cofactor biosynthesis protein [Zoogloea sp.]|uniref:dinitrogenase iron-molybdenum cofactor biosynthesis protein n=1 Tax=Zoogloea sp. TaxID=49181 RepID=UPI0035ADA6BF
MSESSPLTRDIALRLALAVRELPGLDLRGFIGVVSERLGLPLTAAKLASITVADLTQWLASEDGKPASHDKEALKAAVRLLWGEGVDDGLPKAQPYAEGDIPNSLRVAMASNNGELVDGHFGSCVRFLVYQVSTSDYRLVAVRPTAEADTEEDKNVARSALISDCQLVYVQSIGGPAAAKVVRAGVHPVKWPVGGPVEGAIGKLQTAMQAPPPWLARVMGVEAASLARFAEEDETDVEEA